jgi:hypothetical protein
MQAVRMSNAQGMAQAAGSAGSARMERVAMRRILWAGPLAVAAATAATLAALAILIAVLPPINPAFVELAPQSVAMVTAVLCACALPVFALVARFARRPIHMFRLIAAGALLLSWVPDAMLLPDPVSTVPTVIALMVLHVVAAVVLVGTLTAWTRAA